MKRYNAPEIEICAFRAEDIMDTSGGIINGIVEAISPASFDGKLTKFGESND